LNRTRRRIEELLWVLGLSRATAPVWEWLHGGRAVAKSRMMREFYARLLPKGALVFDIGANVGTMTRVFSALGAKVVAVEPNADCLRHIELTTSRAVEVLQAAVGERNGVAVLKVSDRKDKMSSLSEQWREAVTKENRDYEGMWKREVTVPMVTLDALIERYGMPAYIKVDVEGYEEQALKGLSACPALLSLEFNRVFLETALNALENPIFAGAEFNYTLVDPLKFELQGWVGRQELKERILGLGDGAGLGDVFVRKAQYQ
jgi:FkbM family methyltransferase